MTFSRCSAAMLRTLLFAALTLPAAARAEENPGWHSDVHDGTATLFYGIPQSDYGPIAFSCQAGSAEVRFVYAFEPVAAADGVEVLVILQAGDIEVPVTTTGARMQMDDQFLLEGETPLDARLADLLTSQGTLLVFVEDGAEEYSLDGAREAATVLIETCGSVAETAAIESCEFDAWVHDTALVIRDGPSGDAAAIADMPAPYPGYDGLAYPTVSVTGAKDGWFRIGQVTTNLYAEADLVVDFTGEGWVPGKALALYVESPALYAGPEDGAATAVDFSGGAADLLVVDRLYACHGGAVEVGDTYAGSRVRGWSDDICESQITTCP